MSLWIEVFGDKAAKLRQFMMMFFQMWSIILASWWTSVGAWLNLQICNLWYACFFVEMSFVCVNAVRWTSGSIICVLILFAEFAYLLFNCLLSLCLVVTELFKRAFSWFCTFSRYHTHLKYLTLHLVIIIKFWLVIYCLCVCQILLYNETTYVKNILWFGGI